MELYAPMQYVLEGEWETLPVEEKSAAAPLLGRARYSAQWAGMPYEVYAGRKGENDYTDIYQHTL
jgi:hypothetical protein